MKMKIKSLLLLTLFNLLILISAAYSQGLGEKDLEQMFRMPPEQYGHLSAGSIEVSIFNSTGKQIIATKSLYLGTYNFRVVLKRWNTSGVFITRDDIRMSAVDLQLYTGYKTEVCGTFAGTSRYICMSKFEGVNSLEEFSDVEEITISKVRMPDEVVLWVNNPYFPVAYVPRLNNIYDQPDTRLLDAYAAWIPPGYWARLCKKHTSYTKGSECVTYTSDQNNLPGRPYKVYQIGKGTPPPVLINEPRLPKSKMTKENRDILRNQTKKNQK